MGAHLRAAQHVAQLAAAAEADALPKERRYDIRYDDGEYELDVPAALVRTPRSGARLSRRVRHGDRAKGPCVRVDFQRRRPRPGECYAGSRAR